MNNTPPRDVVVFTEAIRLPAIERAEYLARACAGDPELRRKVDALLVVHDRVGDFLEDPPPGAGLGDRVEAPGEKPGDRIGRYRLLQQIGEGGCGVVYMAEQEEPVRRRVALKIIKPGMDTKSVIARFEAERQALALMDHPSIAKVFDAGATEWGRPYFVMELIRGTKITEYCDQNALSTKDRLQLFVQVCQAVQHAHQKGIIHRDLKPSNILVTTTPECEALPVVIDFGIAKATTNQRLTDKTLFTAFEMLIGTPAYMSPEQTALTSVDVDTRTDIYSLGVLLYELLTGSTPFDTGELLKAGLDQVRKVIREQEPPRPSARLSKLTASDLTNVALRRHAEPPALIRSVRGDLDWIVMRALEKDRARRYETANGLAADVKRFLTNETVAARPPSTGYRFRKTVARHKLLFGFLSAIVLLLVVSLTLIAASLAKERRARREAQAEAEKSRQVTRFLEEMLQGVGPSVALGRDTTMLREILDKAADRVSRELTGQPGTKAELQTKIGAIYGQLALYDKAEALQRAALGSYRQLSGESDPQVAMTLGELALVLQGKDKLAEAESVAREALQLRQKIFGKEHADVARSLKDLAGVLRREGKPAEAAAMMEQALDMQTKLLGRENLEVADTLFALGRIRLEQTRFAEAEGMEREVLAIRRKLLGPEHPDVAATLAMLGAIVTARGDQAGGRPLLDESLAMRRKLFGNRHPEVAATLVAIAANLQWQKKPAEAEPILREAISIQRTALGDTHQDTIISMGLLGRVLADEGKPVEAESLDREALAIGRKAMGAGHPDMAIFAQNFADVLLAQKRFAEVEQLYAGLLTPELLGKPQSVYLLRQRMAYFARRSLWPAAAADAAKVVEYRPAGHISYHALAPLLVMTVDRPGYERLCSKMIEIFGRTTDPIIAERMAKDCVLWASSGVDLAAVSIMADTAVEKGAKMREIMPFFLACKALVEYRLGRFERSIQFATRALENSSLDRTGMVYPVLAMAHHRLGHRLDARANVDRAIAVQRESWPVTDDLQEGWQSWIFSHVLLDEAKELIRADAGAEPETKRKDGPQ